MTNQGSYYYSAPLLEVKSFRILGQDDEVISEGNQGTLWMDYVVQSYNKSDWNLTTGANWHFFAIQFPEKEAALVTSNIERTNPPSKFPMAKLFRSTSTRLPNGALVAKQEWSMNEISFTPDPDSAWTSPKSGLKYYTKYTLFFESQDFPATLTMQSVRNDQEIYYNIPSVMKKPIVAYEGAFTASGTINNEVYSGYA